MTESENVTVSQAATMLGVRKEKIARLVKQGVLTSRRSTIDARRRLIPRMQVQRLLQDEAGDPRHAPNEDLSVRKWPWPESVGSYDGPVEVHSDELEEYMREHWKPDWYQE